MDNEGERKRCEATEQEATQPEAEYVKNFQLLMSMDHFFS